MGIDEVDDEVKGSRCRVEERRPFGWWSEVNQAPPSPAGGVQRAPNRMKQLGSLYDECSSMY